MAINGFQVHGALALAVLGSGIGAAIAGGGASGTVLAGPQVLRLIQQAPAALDSYPALSMSMTLHVSGNGDEATEKISGAVTPDGRTGTFTVSAPSIATKIELEAVNGRIYGRDAVAPGSRPRWFACTPSASETAQASTGTDALAYLRLMAGATGQVRALGHDTVDGAKTTHYRVTIDIARALQSAAQRGGPPADQAKIQQLQQAGITTMPVDAWVDQQHALRQFGFTFHLQGITISSKMRIRGTNTVPSVTAPAPTDVLEVMSCQRLFQELAD